MTREEFMQFFRDEEKLNTLTPDDRVEIFGTILLGSSDVTPELFEQVAADYGVNLAIKLIPDDFRAGVLGREIAKHAVLHEKDSVVYYRKVEQPENSICPVLFQVMSDDGSNFVEISHLNIEGNELQNY